MQPFTVDLSQHCVLDPRSGYSTPELASATVTAPSAALADALATATMVLGPQSGLGLIESLPGCEAYLVSKDLEVVKTFSAQWTAAGCWQTSI
jgi:thiamine biosynthesis lipoprotein